MDTKRHEDISKVGAKVLKAALKRAGREELRTGAFCLGNWLTDVQQFVDPPVYASALRSIEGIDAAVKALFDRLQRDAPAFFTDPLEKLIANQLLRMVRARLDRARAELMGDIRSLLAAGGDLAEGFKAAFRFVGYFKFVLPEDGSAKMRMDPDCYFRVFDQRFRQYFPHEHLDRPDLGGRRFATEKADGPTNAWAESSPHATCRARDLYRYLRDDIRTSAGLLAYLDNGPAGLKPGSFGWAAATFHPGRREFADQEGAKHPVSDTDYEWNRHLALLGHALHAVEDYFAHSTFVEHASLAIPATHARWERKEDNVLSFLGLEEVLARRLKEWRDGFVDASDDWRKLPNDTHVATGYFDSRDTIISISHALEELSGRPRETAGRRLDGVAEYDFAKLLKDTLELLSDPAKVWKDARDSEDEDGKNLAVSWLRGKGGKGLNLAEGDEKRLNMAVYLLVNEGPLRDQPQEVKDSFTKACRLLGRGVGIGMMGYTLYKLVKQIGTFITNPLAWLKKYLLDEAYELLKSHGEVYAKMLVANAFGAHRIGCHSLINKDSGPELFHADGMECAKAVHWYVVTTMTRHPWPIDVAVARSSGAAAARQVLSGYRWIDWLELLEYFLDHPFAGVEVHAERIVYGTVQHRTRASPHSTMSSDTLESLARQYARGFVRVVGGPPKLTWEVVADANFPTRGMSTRQRMAQVNKVLCQTDRGVLVSDGVNYAFRPDVSVAIPFQQVAVPDATSADVQDRWWYCVILKKHRVIETWLADGRPGTAAPRLAHRWMPIDRAHHDRFVRDAFQARKRMEDTYNAS